MAWLLSEGGTLHVSEACAGIWAQEISAPGSHPTCLRCIGWVVCMECGAPTTQRTARAEGCPNPGCFVGLRNYRDAMTAYSARLESWLGMQPAGYNRFALTEQWVRLHPHPLAPAERETNRTNFVPWVAPR